MAPVATWVFLVPAFLLAAFVPPFLAHGMLAVF
jgi:hypothetical protein